MDGQNDFFKDLPGRIGTRRVVRDFVLGDRRIAEHPNLHIGSGIAAFPPAHEAFLWGALPPPRPSYRFGYPISENIHGFVEISQTGEFSRSDLAALAVLAALIAHPDDINQNADSRRFGDLLRHARLSLRWSERQVAHELDVLPAAFSSWEAGTSFPTDAEVYRWCQALGLVCPPSTALVRVVDFSTELLRFLQDDATRLRSLAPEQFERFVAERLDKMGYNVTLTGPTTHKDGGIDLIAVPRDAKVGSVVLAGQVKHHRGDQKTGVDAVDRLLAWKDSHFGVGMLVTNTAFTKDAVWKAQQERNSRFLRLRDFMDLKRWLQEQWGSEDEWREIPDRIELAPGVVIEVPRPKIIVP